MTDEILSNVETKVMAGFNGAMVIGDPWLGSPRRVGRVDNAWDASFAKLEQALSLAKERNLMPIIVGDMLHESRDIGQLLPIISLLNGTRALLMPRNSRWQEQSASHIAAILKAAGVVQVVGASADKFQLNISRNGKMKSIVLESYTSWGGHVRLDPGSTAYLKAAGMDVAIMQSSALPQLEGDEDGTRIVAGRLIRLTPVEEKMKVNVYAITLDGVEEIPLNVLPVVFSSASVIADNTNTALKHDSQFVEMLRKTAVESAEEGGKESVIALCDKICDQRKSDDWIRAKMLQLAKDAVEIN
jgi:hypothetical protein